MNFMKPGHQPAETPAQPAAKPSIIPREDIRIRVETTWNPDAVNRWEWEVHSYYPKSISIHKGAAPDKDTALTEAISAAFAYIHQPAPAQLALPDPKQETK